MVIIISHNINTSLYYHSKFYLSFLVLSSSLLPYNLTDNKRGFSYLRYVVAEFLISNHNRGYTTEKENMQCKMQWNQIQWKWIEILRCWVCRSDDSCSIPAWRKFTKILSPYHYQSLELLKRNWDIWNIQLSYQHAQF